MKYKEFTKTILSTNTITIESTDNTPNPTTELKETDSTKIQEPVFKEKEEKKTTSKKIITKTDGLCEVLEKVETNVETYNSVWTN